MKNQDHISQRWQYFQTIHTSLSKGGAVSSETLAKACGLQTRRLKDYIEDMRQDYGAPIDYDWKRKGYVYSNAFDFDISLKLNPKEVNTIELALNTLKQFQSLKMLEDVAFGIEKVEKMIKSKFSAPSQQFIELETMPPYKGSEHINFFLEAIKACQKVFFYYQKHEKNAEPETYTISPYLIKEYRNRFYIISKAEGKEGYRVFGLDRIVKPEKMQILPAYFERERDFKLSDLLKYSYGLYISNEKPQEVILSFTPERGKYQKPKVLEDNETEYKICYQLKINTELVQDILKWGAEVLVVAPESLRQQIKEYHQKALQHYNQVVSLS